MFNEGVANPDDPWSVSRPEPVKPAQGGGAADGEDTAIPRPQAIENAFRASLAATALACVAMVFAVRLEDLARQVVADSGRPLTDENLATGLTVAKVSLGFGMALYATLFVLFAVKMRNGRHWARIALTAFAILFTLNFLLAVAGTGAALVLMWDLAVVAFSVTAVFYLYRPESTRYFAEHRRRRLERRGGGRRT